ncbi:MAG TPA: hypothetical protein VGK73_10450 [Polyangiaceae bacterium]
MLHPQRTAFGLCLLAAIAVTAPARAQILTLDPGQDGVKRDPEHDDDLANNEINNEDCVRNEAIDFSLGIDGSITDEFEKFQVWRGSDCANDEQRFDDSSDCTEITVAWVREDRSLNFAIPVQTLLFGIVAEEGDGTGGTSGSGGTGGSGAGGTGATAGSSATAGTGGGGTGGSDTGGAGGTSATGGTGGSSGEAGGSGSGVTSCDGDRGFDSPQPLTLHFIFVNGNNDQPTENYQAASWDARYDLVGPDAPREVTAGVGENTLVLSWAIEDNRGDIDRYYAYCDPPPNTVPDITDRCGSALIAGQKPPPENFCGESDGYTASMQTSPLENNVTYSVAVAGVDNFNNLGLLSSSACNTPQLVTDFYEAYREAGGEGGGGFCAIGARPSRGFAAFFAFGAMALYARRRARSRRDNV